MAMYFSLRHIMLPNFKLTFVLTSTYGVKIKHRRVVISSLVTFLISVRNNACILRTGCQVRKAVLLYKLIIDLKLKNMQIQINLYVVIICSTTVIFDNGSIIII